MVTGTADNGGCFLTLETFYLMRDRCGVDRAGPSWALGRRKLTENSSGSIVTGETGLAHTRTMITVSRCPCLYPARGGWGVEFEALESNAQQRGDLDPPHVCGSGAGGESKQSLPIVDDESCDFLCNDEANVSRRNLEMRG